MLTAALGGSLVTGPAVIRFFDRLRVFARGVDGTLWHLSQISPGNGWGSWQSHGGSLTDEPAVTTNADGLLQVFSRWSDGQVWTCVQDGPDGLGQWRPLGGQIAGSPHVAMHADGRLTVFARHVDGTLRHISQTSPNSGAENWTSDWPILTGPVTQTPVAGVLGADLRMDVHFVSVGDEPRVVWQTAPAAAQWGGPASLGGMVTSAPVVSRNLDGRCELFAIGTDRRLYNTWQTAPNNGWSGWNPMPLTNLVGRICVARNGDGRLEVFGINDVGDMVHTWQNAPSTGPWHHESLGGQMLGGLGVRLTRLGSREGWHFRE